MQNDFIDGSLGTAEAQAIVPAAAAHIRAAMDAGVTVIATLDTHTPDYMNTSEGRHLPVIHCVKGTPGWQLNPEIEAALKDVEEYVEYIEGKFYVKLTSDREGLIRAKDEWKSMTYAQVAFMASYWKKGLDDRYDQ
jgi:nicotinamidase-related amidase